jgi:hypothetical protein
VAISGQYAYACIAGLFAIDISDPENPQIVNSFDYNLCGYKVTVSGSIAYVPNDGFVRVYDLSNPAEPGLLGESPLGGHQVAVSGSLLCGVAGDVGFYTLPAQCDLSPAFSPESEDISAPPLRVYPAPASRHAIIRFSIAVEGRVNATLYDASGRLVRSLRRETFNAGVHDLLWDTRDDGGDAVATGVYLARVSTARGERTARIVIVR